MKTKNLREIVILHSNDIHGKFVGEKDENGKTKGSLAQLAGYVNKVKSEYPYTLYCVAGDAFQGSLIDSDFQGLSTMDIFNLVDIDMMSLGVLKDYLSEHSGLGGRIDDRIIIK